MNFKSVAISFHVAIARATLRHLTQPEWGYGRVRWRSVYRFTRAQCNSGNALFQWATRHNPLR